jgi:hypothetical protein
MATSRRLQVGLVLGFAALASTAAFGQREPTPTVGEAVVEVAPVTSLITLTTPPVVVRVDYVDDCVEFVQAGAYVGMADMATMWDAAGRDARRLRENCTSLGRGDPEALAEISRRRDELDAFLDATTTTEI